MCLIYIRVYLIKSICLPILFVVAAVGDQFIPFILRIKISNCVPY